MSSHIVKYDNTDPLFIYRNVEQYGPYHGQGWSSLNGAAVDEETEGPIYNNTLQVGPLVDISIEFGPFNGTAIWVYGSIRPPETDFAPLTQSKYSLIGFDYADIPAMNPYTAANVTRTKNNVNFWSKTGMPYNREYTLTINITRATSNMPYYFDYVAVEVPGPARTSASPTPTDPITFGADPPTTSADDPSTSHTAGAVAGKASVPKGAIIGASVGGFVLVATAVLALLFWYRRRARPPPDYHYGSVAQQDPPPHLIPFVNPNQAAAMRQTDDRGLMFVPGLAQDSPAPSLRPQTPVVLPSQKALAMMANRQNFQDAQSGAGSSTAAVDRKDAATFENASQPQSPGPSSEAGSSSGPSIAAVMHPQPSASDLRHVLVDEEESPPAYTPS